MLIINFVGECQNLEKFLNFAITYALAQTKTAKQSNNLYSTY